MDDAESAKKKGQMAKFRPDHKFRQFWNFLILIICVYNAFSIPFRLCFGGTVSGYTVDWVLDILFFVDVYLNMHVGERAKRARLFEHP